MVRGLGLSDQKAAGSTPGSRLALQHGQDVHNVVTQSPNKAFIDIRLRPGLACN